MTNYRGASPARPRGQLRWGGIMWRAAIALTGGAAEPLGFLRITFFAVASEMAMAAVMIATFWGGRAGLPSR